MSRKMLPFEAWLVELEARSRSACRLPALGARATANTLFEQGTRHDDDDEEEEEEREEEALPEPTGIKMERLRVHGAYLSEVVKEVSYDRWSSQPNETDLGVLGRTDAAVRVDRLLGRAAVAAVALAAAPVIENVTHKSHKLSSAEVQRRISETKEAYGTGMKEALTRLSLDIDWNQATLAPDSALFRSFQQFQIRHLERLGRTSHIRCVQLYSRKNNRCIRSNYRERGVGVFPQRFTALKQELVLDDSSDSRISRFIASSEEGCPKRVYVLSLFDQAATLDQVCCFVVPGTELRVYKLLAYEAGVQIVDDHAWLLCTADAALNLAHQGWILEGDNQIPSYPKWYLELTTRELLGLHVRCLAPGKPSHTVPIRATISIPMTIWADTGVWVGTSPESEPIPVNHPAVLSYWTMREICVDYGGEILVAADWRSHGVRYTSEEWVDSVSHLIDEMQTSNCIERNGATRLRSMLSGIRDVELTKRTSMHGPMTINRHATMALIHAYLLVAPLLADRMGTESMTDEDWSYVFGLDSTHASEGHHYVPSESVRAARTELNRTYPLASLTLSDAASWYCLTSLFHHTAIFGNQYCPQRITLKESPLKWHRSPPSLGPSSSASRLTLTSLRSLEYDYASDLNRLNRFHERLLRFTNTYKNMRPGVGTKLRQCHALLLLAHMFDAESAFHQLPLELIALIISHTANWPGFDKPYLALLDKMYRNELNQAVIDIVEAMHLHNYEKLSHCIMDLLPNITERYAKALGRAHLKEGTALNASLLRRCFKIQLCALWPLCPEYCTYAWNEILQVDKSMVAYWSKYVEAIDECDEAGRQHERLRLKVRLDPTIAEQHIYLMGLVSRLQRLVEISKKSKKNKRNMEANPQWRKNLRVRISVCVGKPAWAQPIVDMLVSHLVPAQENEQSGVGRCFDCDVKKMILKKYRTILRGERGVLFTTAVHHLQDKMIEGGPDEIYHLPFNEHRLVTTFASFIAKSVGLGEVQVMTAEAAGTVIDSEIDICNSSVRLTLPGLPHMDLIEGR